MPLFCDLKEPRTIDNESAAESGALRIGLVNNMREAARAATARQFSNLVRAAAGSLPVRLTLYALPEMSASSDQIDGANGEYASIRDLWNDPPHGLIVTGAEPSTARLFDEPYWGSLSSLIDWTEHNTISSVWSCLAAHAAVLHLDGIERRPFAEKLLGVFACRKTAEGQLASRLAADIPDGFRLPHSRWNDVSAIAGRGQIHAGYQILTCLDDTGVDAFIRQGQSLFVFFQGHPEYEADTLLLEYRRDIRRFLSGERADYPTMPSGYFDEEATDVLCRYRDRVLCTPRTGMLDEFPTALLAAKTRNIWNAAAVAFYRNWLTYLLEQRAERDLTRSRGLTSATRKKSEAEEFRAPIMGTCVRG